MLLRRMAWLLWVMVPLSALGLLWVRADIRDSRLQLLEAGESSRELGDRSRALIVERGRLIHPARIRRIAVEQLHMVETTPDRTVLVQRGDGQ